jgi:hypothetical protein
MNHSAWWWRTGLTIVPFVLCTLCCNRVYETNDDAVIQGFASGFYTGTPHSALVFSSVILGDFWKFMYKNLPDWNWYLMTQTLLILVALFTLLQNIKNSWFCVLLAILVSPFWVSPMYTATAMLVTLSGMLLLMRYEQTGQYQWALTGLVLATLGLWVRWHSYLVVWLLCVPVWGYLMMQQRRWQVVMTPLGLLALLLLQYSVESDWFLRHFNHHIWDYQHAIDVIISNPNNIDDTDLQAQHLLPADYALLQNWLGIDSERHRENIWIALADGESSWRSPYAVLIQLVRLVQQEIFYLLALLPVIAWVTKIILPDRIARRWLLILAFIVAGLCGYGLVFFRLPHRLFYPMLLCSVVLGYYVVTITLKHTRTIAYFYYKNKISLENGVVGIAGCMILIQLWLLNARNAQTQQDLQTQYAITQANPDQTFIVSGGAMAIEAFCTWRNPAQGSACNLIPTGWTVHTPAYEAILAYHGIKNPIHALSQRSDIIMMGAPENIVNDYFKSALGMPVELEQVPHLPVQFTQLSVQK